MTRRLRRSPVSSWGVDRVGSQVTVLMAVYNGSRFLETAVPSILNQTCRDFRFLIVDDASTDDTRERIRSYGDDRIDLVCLEKNVGQTAALNIGLQAAATPWIARMDADDYSAPTRLEEQMGLLSRDSSLSCVGTFAWFFREDPHVMEGVVKRPVDYSAIRRGLLVGAAMIHGSMVVSRQAMREIGGYNPRYRYSQDRDLFNRLLTRFQGVNIPKPLLGFRRHPRQGSFCLTAADENVDIFSRMLAEASYSPKEKGILRDSLSYSYLFRALCRRSKGKWAGIPGDLWRALRTSPKATFRGFANLAGKESAG